MVAQNVDEAKLLDSRIPDFREIAALRGSLHDACSATLSPDDAAAALADFLRLIGAEPTEGNERYIGVLVGMLTGRDAVDDLDLADPVMVSPAALAIALRKLLRTERRRPPPAVVIDACRLAAIELDRLADRLVALSDLRDDVDAILDRPSPYTAIPSDADDDCPF
ncbi:hypothetical protein [Rhodoplanes azumiensis]|uniref:Uncharacterized protein n=1 Tax=Rhodoplanes azumiensis TaxID=1897628 RepID=A0ABW5ARD0_9BRAD